MGDKQKTSLLEVKKPVSSTSTSNTRADRVHGEIKQLTLQIKLLIKNLQRTIQHISKHHSYF